MLALVSSILSALAAIPSILKYVEQFASAVMLWYVQGANNSTNAAIADAAAQAARASTQEERYAAVQKWRDALSRPRVS